MSQLLHLDNLLGSQHLQVVNQLVILQDSLPHNLPVYPQLHLVNQLVILQDSLQDSLPVYPQLHLVNQLVIPLCSLVQLLQESHLVFQL